MEKLSNPDAHLRLSVVSYLNSKPFIYGLERSALRSSIDLSLDYPAECARKLIQGDADIGLVPVAVLPDIPNYRIISDYCIGANGAVHSVLLLSEVPLENIRSILLDYQSRTSVQLTKILAREHWKIDPEWETAPEGYERFIRDTRAGVVIGDRALMLRKDFPYVYDLSLAWKEMTGLPFVFACWVANRPVDEKIIAQLNESFSVGLSNIPEVLKAYPAAGLSTYEAEHYLRDCIAYDLDAEKKEALGRFLGMVERGMGDE